VGRRRGQEAPESLNFFFAPDVASSRGVEAAAHLPARAGGEEGGEVDAKAVGAVALQRREIYQDCSSARENAHLADADADTAGAPTLTVPSSK
jgi:hypothetical protein